MVGCSKLVSIKSRVGKKIKSKSLRPILIWSRYRLVLHRFQISDRNNLISWQGKFTKSGGDIFGGSRFNDLPSQPKLLSYCILIYESKKTKILSSILIITWSFIVFIVTKMIPDIYGVKNFWEGVKNFWNSSTFPS